MTLLEYLDRRAERNARYPRDIRQMIGFAFLAGYYIMVWRFATGAVPADNVDLIRDAMLTLGPPVGLIVGAMFRSDLRDEQAARNTGDAFKAVREAVAATPPGPVQAEIVNTSRNPVPTTEGETA